ncbi:chymase-like [Onthophagus taurus]|uniref:chymase-like n=1 Tax=Onthophagus taurus TaxID=166361 RepID=UPI0039BDE090
MYTIYLAFLLFVTTAQSQIKNNSTIIFPFESYENVSFITDDKRIGNGYTIDIAYANFYIYVSCPHKSCGGTLVRRNKVITAAHCVDSCNFRQFEFTVGLNSLSELSVAKKYKAKSIKIHPKYAGSRPYDIAVATLKQNVELNYKVGTINYANIIPPVGGWLCIYGYGLINLNKERPNNLQKGAANIIDVKGTLILTQAQFGSSALPGDSGGPALYNNQLVGVISGYTHCGNTPLTNCFVAVAHPEVMKFIRKYAP